MPQIEFPPGTPDEVKEFHQKQADQQEMQETADRHRLTNFFDSLSQEQAIMMSKIMGIVSEYPPRAIYYQGFVIALLEHKFNVCAGCATNHDKAIEEMGAAESSDG